MLGAVLDYDDAGPNPKHDPRKKPGPGGKPWLQQIPYDSILIKLSLNNNRKNSLSQEILIIYEKTYIILHFKSNNNINCNPCVLTGVLL